MSRRPERRFGAVRIREPRRYAVAAAVACAWLVCGAVALAMGGDRADGGTVHARGAVRFEQVRLVGADGYGSPVFSHDSRAFVARCGDYGVKVWSCATLSPISKPLRHDGVRLYDISADGSVVLTADTNEVRIWDVAAGKVRFSTKIAGGKLFSARLSPDGASFVTSSEDGHAAEVWRVGRSKPSLSLGHEGSPLLAAFDPGGKVVVTKDDPIHIFSADSGREVCEPIDSDCEAGLAIGLQFDPPGRRLLIPQEHGYTMVETATGKTLGEVKVDPSLGVRGLGFSVDGRRTWITTYGHELRYGAACIYDAASGKPERSLGTDVNKCWIGPGDAGWVLCHILGRVRSEPLQLWDLKGGTVEQLLNAEPNVKGSPDGTLFIATLNEEFSRAWRVTKKKE